MNSYQKLGRLQNINNIGTTRHQQHSVCGYWDISASYTSRLEILKIFAPCRAAGPEWISSRHRQVRADAAADHGRGEHPSTQHQHSQHNATLTSGQIFLNTDQRWENGCILPRNKIFFQKYFSFSSVSLCPLEMRYIIYVMIGSPLGQLEIRQPYHFIIFHFPFFFK